MHGWALSPVYHRQTSLFAGLPSPFTACRYHSLAIDPATLPPELEATATTADGTIMALQHRHRPVVGLQFHPEAILTQYGYELLAGFLRLAGLKTPTPLPSLADELAEPPPIAAPLPKSPVTF